MYCHVFFWFTVYIPKSYSVFRKKHPLLFSYITFSEVNQFVQKFQCKQLKEYLKAKNIQSVCYIFFDINDVAAIFSLLLSCPCQSIVRHTSEHFAADSVPEIVFITLTMRLEHCTFASSLTTRSPAVAEGPRDAGVPVEILAAVERLYCTPKEYRSRVCVSLTAYAKVHSHRRD